MCFVSRSKRASNQGTQAQLLSRTFTKEKQGIEFVKAPVNEKTLEAIHKEYTEEKPKSSRNITYHLAMDWSWKEDTYKGFHTEVKGRHFVQNNLLIDHEDTEEDFMRPSHKPKKDEDDHRIKAPDQIRMWRCDNQVNIKAKMKVPVPPMLDWNDCLESTLVESILECGFTKPLVIQSAAIPISLSGYDVIGISHPGTGKTLAYVIPLLQHVLTYLRENPTFDATSGPLGIVLVPTHELAVQVNEVIMKVGEFIGIKSKTLTGSFRINDQAIELGRANHIIVATPGKLKDALENNLLTLRYVGYVVIDEADKMVDKSLGPQITTILQEAPQERRLQMYSATMPNEVYVIVQQFFSKVVQISVGTIGGASETIKQIVHYVPMQKRAETIVRVLHGMKTPIIVFCNSRSSCELCSSILSSSGFRVAMIHGGKSQSERDEIVDSINEDIFDILVSTDVLSRGIDIPNVSNVVNYEVPTNIHTYVHRIGRTGRNGESGVATSIITPNDKEIMYDLRMMLEHGNFAVPEAMAKDPNAKSRYSAPEEPEREEEL